MIRLPRRNPEINADYSPRRRLTAGGLRLNFSDQQRALSEVNRAVGQGPRYVEEDVSSGANAIGKSVQQLSATAQEIVRRNQDITDKRKLYDAETKLAVMGEELQGKLTLENDPNKWESLAREHMAAAEFDTEGMSPAAIEALQQYAERTRALTVARARNGGFAENERQLVGSAMARVETATRNRDLKGIAEPIQTLIDGGHVTPDEGMNILTRQARQVQTAEIQDLRTRVKNKVDVGDYKGAIEDIETSHAMSDHLLVHDKERMLLGVVAAKEEAEFQNAIATNPRAELQELAKPDGKYASKPDWQKQDMTFKAAQMMENKSAVTSKRAVDQMVEKTLTRPEQLDGPEFADLTPVQRQTLKDTLLKGAPNDDLEWMGLVAEINDFTPSDDPDQDALRLAHIENMVEVRFKGPYKDQLIRMIAERRQGDTESDAMAKQKLTQYFKEGFLGTYRVPYVPDRKKWFGFGDTVPGTPLSPADAILTDTAVPEGQRITKGKPVIDVQREAIARLKLNNAFHELTVMKAVGATSKEMLEFVDRYAQQFSIAPALQSKERATTPVQQQPLFNSLPGVSNYMNRFNTDSVNTGAALPDGLSPEMNSPEMNSPNPLLPPIE